VRAEIAREGTFRIAADTYTRRMRLERRGSLYECTGHVLHPRAVVHGELLRTDVTAHDHPAFPEGIHAGVERTCVLTIEGPPFPSGEFDARVAVPRLGQWLRIRVTPVDAPPPHVRGSYTVVDHGPLTGPNRNQASADQ